MSLAKVTATAIVGGGVYLAIAEAAVAPTKFSQFINTKSGVGRGWDCEIGDIHGKLAASKC